jgi:alkylhydroperoxidase family enzyme
MSGPRIPPGTRRTNGTVNWLIARALGLATGGQPPNLFTTLGRSRGLFRGWLHFAGRLMPGGRLPRRDTEIVILRVARNASCEYERRHHVRLGKRAGLSEAEIARTGEPGTEGWSPRETALLRAADELHEQRVLSDELFAELRAHLSEAELIELLLLVGHYEMLATTINSLGIEPDK